MTEEDFNALQEVDACKNHADEFEGSDGYTGFSAAIDGAPFCKECCLIMWNWIKARKAGSVKKGD